MRVIRAVRAQWVMAKRGAQISGPGGGGQRKVEMRFETTSARWIQTMGKLSNLECETSAVNLRECRVKKRD